MAEHACERCKLTAADGAVFETPAAVWCASCWQIILQQDRDHSWGKLAQRRPRGW